MDKFDGLLVLDKPGGMTSREVVDRAQRWFPRRTRIGHTGTLDPLATGVLVLCLGSATRLVEYVQQMNKTYHSIFRLGATSDSDDADGTIVAVDYPPQPHREEIEAALAEFVGTIEQTPPAYSAARVAGQRAHALARRGEEVRLAPRPVTIYRVEVLRYEYPELEVEVLCGKGTYIRSLARDLGAKLGCGGYVQMLRRTRVGPFTPEQAVPWNSDRDAARQRLLPLASALQQLPPLELPEVALKALRQGQQVPLPTEELRGEVAIFAATGEVVAVAEALPRQRLLRPVKVLS